MWEDWEKHVIKMDIGKLENSDLECINVSWHLDRGLHAHTYIVREIPAIEQSERLSCWLAKLS